MALGSGLASSLGIAQETTYGVYAAPSRFHEFDKVDLKKTKNTKQGGGLAAGRYAQLGSRRVVTSEAAAGSFDMEVPNKGMGLLLQHIFGSSSAPVQQAATAAYLQTHVFGDNFGKSLTAQLGIPDTTGTVRPYTYKGGKITSAEFTCGVDDLLTCSIELDCQRVTETETLAAPSLLTGVTPFHFGQMSVQIGTYGAETTPVGVKKMSCKIERGQADDRFYAASTTGALPALKAEPITNDWVKVSGGIDTDFVDKTVFADRFRDDASASLVWSFTGPLIASTFYQRFTIKLPMIFLDGDTPTVEGVDVVSPTFPYVAQLDGTNPLVTCEYVSTDTVV